MIRFDNLNTLEELKKAYRAACKTCHPDLGGSDQAMSDLNAEYEKAYKRIRSCGTTGTSTEDKAEDSKFRDIIFNLITLPGIEIEICSTWLWISGDTREHKEEIKAAGCKWARKKKKWYWHPESIKKSRRGTWDMGKIRSIYGSQRVVSTASAIA